MLDLLTANDAPGAYPDSWYAATADFLDPLPPLAGDARCDVCVIGAGYTGLSAALHLAERGYAVRVLEAHRVGWGASGRNGGQVASGLRVDQDALEAMLGPDAARALWRLAEEARALVPALIARHGIACDYARGHLHADLTTRHAAASRAYAARLRGDYGYDAIRFVARDEIRALIGSPLYRGGLRDDGAAHLHPLNYALGLARAALAAGAVVHERSQALRFERAGGGHRIETAHGRVTADHVLLAGNGYLGGLDGRVAARCMPINNFLIATEPLGEARARDLIRENLAVSDSKFVVNYFRLTPDWRLLFGGGETYGYRFPRDIAGPARAPMLRIFPQLKGVRIDHAWGGTLSITMNRLPFVRRLENGLLTAGGYSGQGVALGTLAGKILAEAVAGTAERLDLFAAIPTPRFPGGAALRRPLLVAAMSWYALRDRLAQMA